MTFTYVGRLDSCHQCKDFSHLVILQIFLNFTRMLCKLKAWQFVPKRCTSCDLAGEFVPAVEVSSIGQTGGAGRQAASQATLPQTPGHLTA